MQLVWSNGLSCPSSGYALGWQTSRIFCVLAIVEEWSVEAVLAAAGTTSELACSVNIANLKVVGQIGESKADGLCTGLQFVVRDGILTGSIPGTQIILVDPPDRDRLRYLTPIQSLKEAKASSLAVGLEVQDDYGPSCNTEREGDAMEEIIEMVNSMRDAQRQIARIVGPQRRSWAVLRSTASWIPIFSTLGLAISPCTAILSLVVYASNCKLPFVSSSNAPLARWSATIAQLALRAQQILQAPQTFRKTLQRPGVSVQTRSKRYMKFWNTVWLILNDLILGYCSYEIISHNHDFLAFHFPALCERHLANDIVSSLNWLNDWPVGLKLNTPLSQFFCSTFGSVIIGWKESILPFATSAISSVLTALAFASLGGLTLTLAVLQDVINLFTLHLRLCNMVTRAICRWQLASLSGLWNLFRGKRWNVLRQRTDSYAYDVDQLFLGTLLFTVSAFLFPTVLTYAGLFFLISMIIQSITSALRTSRAALNSFPLFEVLLRVKEPSRLPAGINFVLRPTGKGGVALPCLELRNSPKTLSDILAGVIVQDPSAARPLRQ